MSATYTVKQVAGILGYSTNSIYTFLKERRLQGVRVGKGRFRIPQSELDRLLGTSERVQNQTGYGFQSGIAPAPSGNVPSAVIRTMPTGAAYDVQPFVPSSARVEVPSIFDWFLGLSAIVLGLAMYLFSQGYEEFYLSRFLLIIPVIRISLISGGLGLLLTDVVGMRRSVWHRIFHGILTAVSLVFSFVLFRSGSMDGFAMFGALAVILVLNSVFTIDGVKGFVGYISLFLAVTTVVSLSGHGFALTIPQGFPEFLSAYVLNMVYTALLLCTSAAVWYGYGSSRRIFVAGLMAFSALMILQSVIYAQSLMWGRSLYSLLLGVISFFVPVSTTLTFAHKRDRLFVFGSFGSILCLFVIAIGAVRIMQTNIIRYATHELENKATYGKFLLESVYTHAQSTVISSAANPILVEAVENGDTRVMENVIKGVFDSNSGFRRLVVVTGSGPASPVIYPHTATDTTVYAAQGYVLRAISGGKPNTTEQFEDGSGTIRRKIITITSPVIRKDGKVLGVLIGMLDLEGAGAKLQQIVSSQLGEYIMILDKDGKIASHPDPAVIGTDAQSADFSQDLPDNPVKLPDATRGDTLSMHVVKTTEETDGLVIRAISPIRTMLQIAPTAEVTIFSVTLASLLVVAIFLFSHRQKYQVYDAQIVADDGMQKSTDHTGTDSKKLPVSRTAKSVRKKHYVIKREGSS